MKIDLVTDFRWSLFKARIKYFNSSIIRNYSKEEYLNELQ